MKINHRRLVIRAKIDHWNRKLQDLQRDCQHSNVTKKARSDTGNWCSGDDSYWYEYTCPDCGKFWSTPQ